MWSHPSWRPVPLLTLILLLFLLIQGQWIAQNETVLGSDAGAHLVRSVEVLDATSLPVREAISTIWQVSEHRPPFSYILTLPFYGLLGRGYDAALWSNTVWLAATALVVFLFARAAGDGWDGLWSALLALATPLLFQLARLYYQETLVTLTVWAALLFLLWSEGFSNRRAALAFGVAAGIGLLVKWTIPALLAGALLWVLWRCRGEWRAHPAPTRRAAAVAMALALPLTAGTAWLLAPVLEGSPSWLFVALWALLYFLSGYYLLVPSATRLSNALLAAVTAALVASWWYFPEMQFAEFFSDLVFGDAGRPDELGGFSVVSYLQPATWLFYVRAFAFEQGGLFWLIAFALALAALAMRARNGPRETEPLITGAASAPSGIQLIAGSLFAAWLLFTLSPFRDHARSIAPLLPAVAILTVYGLRRLPVTRTSWRRTGTGALALILGWQVFQFVALSLPQGEPAATVLQRNGLLVEGSYHYYPDRGTSAAAYHIAPDLLSLLRNHLDEDGRVSLATFINETQLHQNTLRAEFELLQPGVVRVIPLTRGTVTPYADLFNSPFVLYKTGVSNDLSPEASATLERILSEPAGLFAAAYGRIWSRPLPGGDEIILAQRRHALVPSSVRAKYEPVAATLDGLLTTDDALLVDNPAQVNPLGALGVAARTVVTDPTQLAPGQRLFALLWQPDARTEPLLNESLIRSEEWWFDDIHLIAYIAPSAMTNSVRDVGVLGGEQLAAISYTEREVAPGGGLLLSLDWVVPDGAAASGQRRTVLELYDAQGALIARRDLPPDPAFASGRVTQRTALVLPNEIGPLPACLIIARYDPATGERLSAPSGDDKLQLCL